MNTQMWHGKQITVADLPLPVNHVKPTYITRGRSVSRVHKGVETFLFDAQSAIGAVVATRELNGEQT